MQEAKLGRKSAFEITLVEEILTGKSQNDNDRSLFEPVISILYLHCYDQSRFGVEGETNDLLCYFGCHLLFV